MLTRPSPLVWQPNHELAASCVGLWDCGAGAGDTILDRCQAVGHTPRHGTKNAGAAWAVDAIHGNVLTFNGTTGKVEIGDFAEYQFTTENFSLFALFREPNPVAASGVFFGKGNNVGEGCPYCLNCGSGPSARMYVGNGTNISGNASAATVSAGNWYLMIGVRNSTSGHADCANENGGGWSHTYVTLGNKANVKIGCGSLGAGTDYAFFGAGATALGAVAMCGILNIALSGTQRALLHVDPWCLLRAPSRGGMLIV